MTENHGSFKEPQGADAAENKLKKMKGFHEMRYPPKIEKSSYEVSAPDKTPF
jgi:hypothetical protein